MAAEKALPEFANDPEGRLRRFFNETPDVRATSIRYRCDIIDPPTQYMPLQKIHQRIERHHYRVNEVMPAK
jgi:hypothetical protein